MGSPNEWIAPLIERCLKFYLEESEDTALQVDDDGSNLRFKDGTARRIVVDDFTQGRSPVTILTDPRTQIEATLTRESLKDYQKNSPGRNLTRDTVKGYIMLLVDYEVVFEYTTSEPRIHLYVERFRIEWDRGRLKSARRGKKITKNTYVFNLMRKAFMRTKESQETHETANSVDGYQSDNSVKSQKSRVHHQNASQGIVSGNGASQEAFASQAPHIHKTPGRNTTSSDHGPSRSEALLGRLGLNSGASNRDVSGNNVRHKNTGSFKDPGGANLTENDHNPLNTQPTSNNLDNEEPAPVPVPEPRTEIVSSIEPPDSRAEKLPQTTAVDRNVNQVAQAEAEQGQFTIKVEETSHTSPRERKAGSPAREGSLKAQQAKHSSKRPSPTPYDPWTGWTKIRKNDVKIPKEQVKLLESNRCWVPAPPGERVPEGHVPPSLLNEWNRIALQRSRPTTERVVERIRSEPINERESSVPDAPDAASPAASSASQESSMSDEEQLSWSESPQADPPPRNKLPADSSPVTMKRARKTDTPTQEKPPEIQLPNDTDSEVAEKGTQNSHSPIKNSETFQTAAGVSAHQSHRHDHEQVNRDSVPEVDMATHIQHPEDETGNESDEDMETAVPCPLQSSSQQAQLTEDEQMEDAHSTASIELGDDEPSTTATPAPLPLPENEPEAPNEPEDIFGNWFGALRHLRPPTGPVWSDDPNTPFKKWARADQNVKCERKNFRGGAYLSFDEKNVLQRPLPKQNK